jgi:hypothetical protein
MQEMTADAERRSLKQSSIYGMAERYSVVPKTDVDDSTAPALMRTHRRLAPGAHRFRAGGLDPKVLHIVSAKPPQHVQLESNDRRSSDLDKDQG